MQQARHHFPACQLKCINRCQGSSVYCSSYICRYMQTSHKGRASLTHHQIKQHRKCWCVQQHKWEWLTHVALSFDGIKLAHVNMCRWLVHVQHVLHNHHHHHIPHNSIWKGAWLIIVEWAIIPQRSYQQRKFWCFYSGNVSKEPAERESINIDKKGEMCVYDWNDDSEVTTCTGAVLFPFSLSNTDIARAKDVLHVHMHAPHIGSDFQEDHHANLLITGAHAVTHDGAILFLVHCNQP